MRTPGLQYLYLQKPLFLIILVATLSVLPWIGLGDYYTKGEPREASVAVSMIEEGNWILPRVYADEFAYKPPLTHWLMAAFSLPAGKVTPFTSRLPSALSFIVMVGCCFFFFGKRMKGQEAFIAGLILITSFELHRAAMTSRVDMLLTALTVGGLISLFYWAENKRLKGLPWYIPLILGCAALVKGPIGILLPLLVFGIYLLLTKYNFWKSVWKCVLVGAISLIPLLIWYYLAYQQAGESFLEIVKAENFGRFFSSDDLEIRYNLGHEEPIWYNLVTLIAGFIPWTLFLFFSLFGWKYLRKIPSVKKWGHQILSMDRLRLFSLIASVVIVIFYSIPVSKRSVYLMPAYPFIAVFMAQYIVYITEYLPKVNRFFSVFIGSLMSIVGLLCILSLCRVIDLSSLILHVTHSGKTIHDVDLIGNALAQPGFVYILLLGCFLYGLYALYYQLRKKNNLKILYATFGLYIVFGMLQDGVPLPALKDGTSVKPFITKVSLEYPLTKNNMYVMNNLMIYANLYGANFYLHNSFQNFEKTLPEEGFFFSTPGAMSKLLPIYEERYEFRLLDETPDRYNDVREVVQLYEFKTRP